MTEPRLNFAHICDYAFNGESGKACIIGIFKNINIPKAGFQHPQLFIVTNISVESKKEYKKKVRLVKEDNQDTDIIPPLNFNILVSEGNEQIAEVGFIGQINNIAFPSSGKYIFKIYIDDKLIGNIPVNVSIKS